MRKLSEILRIGSLYYKPITGEDAYYNAMCWALEKATERGLITQAEKKIAQNFCKDLTCSISADEEWLMNAIKSSFKVSSLIDTLALIYSAVIDKLEHDGN